MMVLNGRFLQNLNAYVPRTRELLDISNEQSQ